MGTHLSASKVRLTPDQKQQYRRTPSTRQVNIKIEDAPEN